MALKLEDKQAIITEVAEIAGSAYSAVVAEYRGLSVADMTDLRKKARESNVYLKVVRNTLARRAVEGTHFSCLQEALVGPVVLAFSQEEPGSAARVIRDFVKTHEKMIVTAIAVGGKKLPSSELDAVAKLPTYKEALSTLLAVMKAPISKFVRTLAEPHAKLARTIAAIRDQKQSA